MPPHLRSKPPFPPLLVVTFSAMVSAFLALPRNTHAAPGAGAPTDNTVKAEARERFDRGLGLFEKGENAAALAEFKRAYELIANPVVLYNIGLVYAAMNRPVEATDALNSFLTAGAKASSEQQKKALRVRDEQAARVAGVLVVTDHPATVEIDGSAVGRTPLTEPLRVASGAHTISALAPGYQPARREVTLAGQVTVTVTLSLVPTESGAAHLTVVTPVPAAEVWINGKMVGLTPLPSDVSVTPGTVNIELRRVGYLTTTRSLRVDEGASAKLELPLDENPADSKQGGRVRVTLAEQGPTDITIDGRPRSLPIEALWLPAGPHVLTAARAGYEPYQTNLQVVAGNDTTMVLALTPTLETRARLGDEAHGRRVLGWSLVAGGVAVAAGAGILAVVTRHDVDNAQAALNTQLAKEQDPSDKLAQFKDDCYLGSDRVNGRYEGLHCAEKKSGLQDDVDSAKLKRILAYSGIGLGVVAAGIGAYFAATASSHEAATPGPRVSFWQSGDGAGLSLAGRF